MHRRMGFGRLQACLVSACLAGTATWACSKSNADTDGSDAAVSEPTSDAGERPTLPEPSEPQPTGPSQTPEPSEPAEPTGPEPAEPTATPEPIPEPMPEPIPEPGTPTGACGNAAGQYFPPAAPWNTPVDDAPLDAESDAIIGYLSAEHDTGTRFQIDFSLRVLQADDSVEHVPFTPNGDFYEGECDPAPVPVPEGGSLEGEDGYACDSDGDCHLIVFDRDECRLFEMWRADIRGGDFSGGCLAIWETDRVYGPEGRGDFCTSADAAGLPIAPLLFNADEVFAGEVRHAIRFILPNQHIRADEYVRPGTHSTRAASGPAEAPPYSARLRLKASTDLTGLSPGARVVAKGLQTYGMYLADGGNLTFTGQSDRDTEHSWDEAQLSPQDLKGLTWDDFEVVELGERISYSSGECERTPISE